MEAKKEGAELSINNTNITVGFLNGLDSHHFMLQRPLARDEE